MGRKIYCWQLDVLRGLAIVQMVVNHAGVELLRPEAQARGFLGALVFLGSFAPVVFFFTTGFGTGLARSKVTLAAFRSTLVKAGLLLLADQFLFWRVGVPVGLDFLGFIALSSVMVTLIAACPRPLSVSAALIIGALVLRFGIGHWSRAHGELPAFAEWLIGATPVEYVSYPFAPWVVYPLLGFLMGRYYLSTDGMRRSFLWPWVWVPMLTSLALSALLYRAHANFFRWGTMNLAFFVLSIGVLFICVSAAWSAESGESRATRLLSLRGISSFAVVPIHYALIEVLLETRFAPLQGVGMLTAMVVLVAASMGLARLFAAAVNAWISGAAQSRAGYILAMLVVLSCAAIWLMPGPATATFAAMVVGQLAIAGLIAVRDHRRAAPAVTQRPAV